MESVFNKLAARPERSIVLLSLVLLLAGNWILPLTDRFRARYVIGQELLHTQERGVDDALFSVSRAWPGTS